MALAANMHQHHHKRSSSRLSSSLQCRHSWNTTKKRQSIGSTNLSRAFLRDDLCLSCCQLSSTYKQHLLSSLAASQLLVRVLLQDGPRCPTVRHRSPVIYRSQMRVAEVTLGLLPTSGVGAILGFWQEPVKILMTLRISGYKRPESTGQAWIAGDSPLTKAKLSSALESDHYTRFAT